MKPEIPILMYHKIRDLSKDNPKFLTWVSPTQFKNQMEWLYQNKYTTISFDTLIEDMEIPSKSIIITFDDGFKDNYTNAFPILKKYGFTATIFLTTDYIGRTNEWDKKFNELIFPMLSVKEIKEMNEYGISFGAHTCSHPDLRKLTKQEAEKEIRKSKTKIEELIGKPVTTFCYPFGLFNDETKQIVKEVGFKCACSVRIGPLRVKDDVYAIRRIPIYPQDNGWKFKFKISNWYFWLFSYKRFAIGPRLRHIILGKELGPS